MEQNTQEVFQRLNEKIEKLQKIVNAKRGEPDYEHFSEHYENKVYALDVLLEIRDGE